MARAFCAALLCCGTEQYRYLDYLKEQDVAGKLRAAVAQSENLPGEDVGLVPISLPRLGSRALKRPLLALPRLQ